MYKQEILFKTSMTATFAKLLEKLTIPDTGAATYIYLVTKVLYQWKEVFWMGMEIQLQRRDKITISSVTK